jgi:hypothetical protein
MDNKHAYLIIAYDHPLILQKLICALDDKRNDIFIHIDKKANISIKSLNVKDSNLYIMPESINAGWGDVSLVKIELLLIEEMLNHGHYQYCHFLSDSDFPIKSQDYIHNMCDVNADIEYIGYCSYKTVNKEITEKVQYYYLYAKYFKNGNRFQHITRYLFLKIQHILGYKRNRGINFKKGAQWCSITYDFAKYLYSQKDKILKIYAHTYCSDEIFIQTACWNSIFRKNIYCVDDEYGCLRYIKWSNNVLYPIKESDINNMIISNKWFARKFSEDKLEIVDEVYRKLAENV